MKTDVHPKYYPDAKVTCACGATFTVGSTMPAISVEICRECHPFYTGTDKLLDTAGRVEKFKQRTAFAKASAEKSADKTTPKKAKKVLTKKTAESPEAK
jgi:large subunit ribosomal protein L31